MGLFALSLFSGSPRVIVAVILVLSSFSNAAQPARGDSPNLDFDLGQTAECRDVTSESFAASRPSQRVVEATLRTSVRLLAGDMNDVQDIRIEITDSDRSMAVHSFAPTTQLASRLAEDIEWTKTTEVSNSLSATLGGELPAPIGNVVAHLAPSVSGGRNTREVVTEKQKRLAPKEVHIASGTMDNGRGVFFRLRPTSQTTLEGVHELTVRFVVPADWRGDRIAVRCAASGQQKFLWMKQHKTWRDETIHVVLHLEGDEAARRAAERELNRRL